VFITSGVVKFLYDNQRQGRFAKLGLPAPGILLPSICPLVFTVASALPLSFFDELSHEQVAAALKIPFGTVKARVTQACPESPRQRE
jgi:hypothetical protein